MIFAPFPLLWLGLGLFVNKAVFRFWMSGQSINGVESMILMAVPVFFTIFYLSTIAVFHKAGKPITPKKVIVSALISALVGYVLSPTP